MILQGFEPQDRTACCVLVAVTQNSCVPPLSAAEQRAMLRVAVAVGCLRRCNGRGGASDCRARRRRWAPPPGVGFKEARLARVLQLALWEDAAAAAAAATAAAVVDADRCWLTPTLPQLRLPPPGGGARVVLHLRRCGTTSAGVVVVPALLAALPAAAGCARAGVLVRAPPRRGGGREPAHGVVRRHARRNSAWGAAHIGEAWRRAFELRNGGGGGSGGGARMQPRRAIPAQPLP